MKYIRWRHHQNKSHMKYHKRNIINRQCIHSNHINLSMYLLIYVNMVMNHHKIDNYYYFLHYTLDIKYYKDGMC